MTTRGKWERALRAFAISGLLLVGISSNAQEITLDRAGIRIDLPGSWTVAEHAFGMPFVLMGPHVETYRPVITVTPTGLTQLPFKSDQEREFEERYRSGREAWLQNRGGRSISFLRLESAAGSTGTKVYRIGYRYELSGETFVETSQYLLCSGHLYHFKTLLRSGREHGFSEAMSSAIRDIRCD